MILLDTSVWIEFFRSPRGLDIETIVDFDQVVVCPPVVQEVLQGLRGESDFRLARQAMLSMPAIEPTMTIDLWIEAAQLYRAARAAGATVRSSVDCLIAACALRHDLEVLHRDRDFTALSRVSKLRQRQI